MSAALIHQVLMDVPVLYWPHQAGTGIPPALAGNSPTQNGGAWVAGSPFQWALDLNGTSTHVSRELISTTGLPVGSSARTLEGWCHLDVASGTLIAYGQSNNANHHCILTVGSAAFTDGVNAGNNTNWATTTPTGRWVHVAMTYAGGAGGTAIFYLNGVADVTTTLSLTTHATNDRFRNGVRSDDARATNYLNGRVAHTAVYASALSADRIKAHYQAGLRSGAVMG